MSLLPLTEITSLSLGNKARLLGVAKNAGLPVPETFVLLDSSDIPEAPIAGPMAVRSAFSLEDQSSHSGAGMFLSKLNVTPEEFHDSVDEVRRSAERVEEACRQDVMVMEMVRAENAGVAFLQPDFLDDYVEYVSGLADDLLSGRVEGNQVLSSRLANSIRDLPFGSRLHRLLTQVWEVFGEHEMGWDIEWADDGQQCWLLQIRPITRAPLRNEWLTYANIREILPDPPSPLMTDIVLNGSTPLYGYYRGFDSELPESRALIEEVHGRPVFNLSLLCETIRWWGLPSRLVTDNIGGANIQDSSSLNLAQFLKKAPVLLKQGWSQLTCIWQARRATRNLIQLRQKNFDSLQDCGEAAVSLFSDLVSVMLNLTAALSAPLAILRLFGVLSEHSARHRSISTAMYEDLEPLQKLVSANPEWREELSQGSVPEDETFSHLWSLYLDKHGHRGIYESDLARPRYHEEPKPLLQSLCNEPRHSSQDVSWTWKARLTAPLWWWCSAVLRTRELWRYESMKCYDHLRQEFLRLSSVGERVFQLRLKELKMLDSGQTFSQEFWTEREQEIEEFCKIDLPHTFQRFAPLTTEADDTDHWQGVGLTGGRVAGRAWVLSSPESELPADLRDESVILIARTVDAGWIPTFRLVDAVAVELGGDLSHGSIILRELGFPAITSAMGVWSGVETGDKVILNADRGTLSLDEAGVV